MRCHSEGATSGVSTGAGGGKTFLGEGNGDDGVMVGSSMGEGLRGDGRDGLGGGHSRGGSRSSVASKRLRLLLLHGNSSAASLLLQVKSFVDIVLQQYFFFCCFVLFCVIFCHYSTHHGSGPSLLL